MADVEEFIILVKSLPMEKKMKLESMGFEFVVHFDSKVVRKTMCRWVIDHFDPSTNMLEFYGDKVELTPRHVEYLLGFKDKGLEIELGTEPDTSSMDKSFVRFTKMDIKGMATELRKIPHHSPNFKCMFTLFLMTTICSLIVDRKRKPEWVHLVINVDTIQHWNSARFVFNETVEAINDFKLQSSPTKLGGCPLFLMAIFCELSPKDRLGSIWKYDLPRIRDWSDIDTKALHDVISKLPKGYRSNKLMGLIEKDKGLISGKVPTTHAENVEKAFSLC